MLKRELFKSRVPTDLLTTGPIVGTSGGDIHLLPPVIDGLSSSSGSMLMPASSSSVSPLPLQPKMCVDNFIKAIMEANIPYLEEWYLEKPSTSTPFEEAGFDLATQLARSNPNYLPICDMILTELKRQHAQSQVLNKPNPSDTKCHYHATVEFDDRHYFNLISLEIYDNGMILLRVHYQTYLARDFIYPTLLSQGGKDRINKIVFNFNYYNSDQEEINLKFHHIFHSLIDIETKNGGMTIESFNPLITTLVKFFEHRQQNTYEYEELSNEYKPNNSYEAYELWKAACYLDAEGIFRLLQNGADPNQRFDNETILFYAAHLGSQEVFNPQSLHSVEDNSQRLLQIIQHLITYGANPWQSCAGDKSLIAFLVNTDLCIKQKRPQLSLLYQSILSILPASPKAKADIWVHPEALTEADPIAHRVVQANQVIQERWYQGPSLFQAIRDNEGPTSIFICPKQGAAIKIESVKVANLSSFQYKQLFYFFASHPAVNIMPLASDSGSPTSQDFMKRDYFDKLMQLLATGTIDIISQNGILKGMIISKFIEWHIDGKSVFIYYPKLGLADKTLHPGLITALIWLRGFTCQKHLPPDTRLFGYYDAASAGGFVGAQMLRRFPIVTELKPIMPELIKQVHGADIKLEEHQDCYYIPARLKVVDARHDPIQDWPSLTTLGIKSYYQRFSRVGQLLPVAFLVDKDNWSLLQTYLERVMTEETLTKLLDFYSEQTQQELCGPTLLRPYARL